MKQSVKIFLLLIAIFGSVFLSSCVHEDGPLTGKTVCLDPGHGGTSDIDSYRVGVAGEREEWIDLRVALKLKSLLEEKDCRVIMTREKDVAVPLKERALMAIDGEADAFISIHHNATADTTVNFPTVYFHGNASENQASVLLGLTIIRQLRRSLFHADTPVSLVSDHTIFPTAGTAVLRHSYGLPGVIGEASFFSNPSEEQRLKQNDYNDLEAMAYLRGLEEYFSAAPLPVLEKNSLVTIAPFEVFQEA
ncbi:MAG: N-acetylmuramoyl-L-alanine amidase, partial [Calditrichales bacterium]